MAAGRKAAVRACGCNYAASVLGVRVSALRGIYASVYGYQKGYVLSESDRNGLRFHKAPVSEGEGCRASLLWWPRRLRERAVFLLVWSSALRNPSCFRCVPLQGGLGWCFGGIIEAACTFDCFRRWLCGINGHADFGAKTSLVG